MPSPSRTPAVRPRSPNSTSVRGVSRPCSRPGVGAESVVGLAVPRSIDMVASVLGVLRLGAAYLPLDLTHPADRISYMLEDSGARILLSTEAE